MDQEDFTPDPVIEAPSAPVEPSAPQSLHEAMWPAEPDEPQTDGRPRDELGRFAPKTAETPVVDPLKPVEAKPVTPVVEPVVEEDITAMPEGLGAKAQERFQKLANTKRELEGRVEQLDQQVSYVRETFQQHGIQKEQFEQAASVIGMMNRGDMEGALKVLDEQRRLIAISLGKPVAGVDALQQWPDLRQAVDTLQIDEARALEVARARMHQETQQRQHQTQVQQRQAQEQQQQAVTEGQRAVDEFCRQMQSTDMDYSAIEAKLLPEIPNLLQGVPPQAWKGIIATQYRLMKQAASAVRTAPTSGPILRPNGPASPAAAPKSMHEAMWGSA